MTTKKLRNKYGIKRPLPVMQYLKHIFRNAVDPSRCVELIHDYFHWADTELTVDILVNVFGFVQDRNQKSFYTHPRFTTLDILVTEDGFELHGEPIKVIDDLLGYAFRWDLKIRIKHS